MRLDKDYLADWTNHHIEGYARAAQERGETGYFKAPLISHVEGNLWQGGCYEGVHLPDDFKHVISLYKWEKYHLGPDTKRMEVTMYDAGEMPDIKQLHEIAQHVSNCMDEGKTLVHCQAGLNRSGLVATLALVKRGHSVTWAIQKLRDSRSPLVLCNKTFEDWLLTTFGS